MMWLFHLHETQPVAQAIGVVALVCAAGRALGSINIGRVELGSAGVLLAGIVAGYFSVPVDHATLEFVKELGLILFVFTIGLQLGPAFFAALRRNGLQLNAFAAVIVLIGSAVALALGRVLGLDFAATLGILSGATTNTPSLGAAQQALTSVSSISDDRQILPALAYAVTYPAAIGGMIATLLGLKELFPLETAKVTTTSESAAQESSPDSVDETGRKPFMPLAIGIAAGIVLGTMPIPVPGLPQPVQLGLAGGPLIVALILGRVGRIGRVAFYMPIGTNLAFREFGIALFFAAVGLAAGPTFFATVFGRTGLLWLGVGLCVTVLPLLIAGVFARIALHMNFSVLGGLLAGSMTDPPALTFVTNLTRSDAPMLTYVTVFPMTTLLRILVAQGLALSFIH
jgi:AspT/YidE/YbjL antiporter-like protein